MAGTTIRSPFTHADYTIGWVCALPKEQTAAVAMLDERHPKLPSPATDVNTYNLGSINQHNIVIVGLPKGKTGNNPAAAAVTQMVNTFPSLKAGLMVGIGGGVPPKVRLGDVVVSSPTGQYPGVVQWDMGKATAGDKFVRTGSLSPPPSSLLTALAALEAEHPLTGSRIPEYLDEMRTKWPKLSPQYTRSETLNDVLFDSNYEHIDEPNKSTQGEKDDNAEGQQSDLQQVSSQDCRYCDHSRTIKRTSPETQIHYGLIVSGNQVIKNASQRDSINSKFNGEALCIEMEAAGLMDRFPCLVIRGICDYADSHKNKAWQEYAAATAAAFAKELLQYVPISHIQGETPLRHLLGDLKDDLSTITEHVSYATTRQQMQHDREILDWLIEFDYGTRHTEFLSRRQPGTGRWLLQSAKYQAWLKSEKKTLFCPGIPGAGKTILSSIVIEDLHRRFNNGAIGVAFIYCEYNRKDIQNIGNLFSSLLKQLVAFQSAMPEAVKELYKRHEKTRTRPQANDIIEILIPVISAYSNVFIVIDAVDEFKSSVSQTVKCLEAVFDLQAKTGLNLLVTSRYIPEIVTKFGDHSENLEIRATPEDVEAYLSNSIQELPACVNNNAEFRIEVINRIVDATDGMFLLARLHLEGLHDKFSRSAVRVALTHVDTGENAYDKAYETAMERIRGQSCTVAELATKALAWLTCAERVLTTKELRTALSVNTCRRELDGESLIEIDIASICAGLVSIDEQDHIRFIHYTAREYFEQTQFKWFPTGQSDLGAICVTYLSFQAFESGYCSTEVDFEQRKNSYPLYDYAAHFWGYHGVTWGTPNIQTFLESKLLVEAAGQALLVVHQWKGYSQDAPRSISALHLAAYFGLQDISSAIIERENIHRMDSNGRTPLSWAAENGHEAVAQLLLRKGSHTENTDNGGQTPLSWAAGKGHLQIVQLMIKKGASIEKADFGGQTPLFRAAGNGHQGVVKLLLDNGANIETPDKYRYRQTPLSRAAANGHDAAVKLLLEMNAKVEALDMDNRTPLSWAAENGHDNVTTLLLDKGAQITVDKYNRTPLCWAAENGHESVVRLLLLLGKCKRFIDFNPTGQTPLSRAIKKGHQGVTHLLLENGANLEIRDSNGQTPLSHALESRHEGIMQSILDVGGSVKDTFTMIQLCKALGFGNQDIGRLLLEKYTDLQRTSFWASVNDNEVVTQMILQLGASGRMADAPRRILQWAANTGNAAMVRHLLDSGADLEFTDALGQTLLHRAVRDAHDDVALLLIENGVDLEKRDIKGHTPLFLAVRYSRERVIQLLLEKELNLGTLVCLAIEFGDGSLVRRLLDCGGNVVLALNKAVECGRENVVRHILERGSHIETHDKAGGILRDRRIDLQAALCMAASDGYMGIVQLLLDNGANIESRNQAGLTALICAAKNGHASLVQRLLKRGANPEACVSFGYTPFVGAVEDGNEALVRLLLDEGADIESPVGFGETALIKAAENGHSDVVLQLLRQGANVESSASVGLKSLSYATAYGHEAVVRLLLDKGAGIEFPASFGGTPLSKAAENGHAAVVRLLLDKGANIESSTASGLTPLSHAIANRHEAIVRLLLDKGANVECSINFGDSPLGKAAENGHEAVVRLLLDRGASIESIGVFGLKPLSYARGNGYKTVVQLLLDKGAKVQSSVRKGGTPLSMAAANGHGAIVQLLLERGSNIESTDALGQTPLYQAVKNGRNIIVQLLLKNGSDINTTNDCGQTLLHCAAKNGHATLVYLLLDLGADIERFDDFSLLPIDYAANEGHGLIARILNDRRHNKHQVGLFGNSNVAPSRRGSSEGLSTVLGLETTPSSTASTRRPSWPLRST